MKGDKDLIPIANFGSEHEANILRLALNDRGIKATVSGDVSAFGTSVGPSGVSVYVRRIEVDSAREVIRQMPEEDAQLCPEWKCKCGETVDEGYAICWSCGAEFSGLDSA